MLSLPPKNQRFCCLVGIPITVEGPLVPALVQGGFVLQHGAAGAGWRVVEYFFKIVCMAGVLCVRMTAF